MPWGFVVGPAERDPFFSKIEAASDPSLVAFDVRVDVVAGGVYLPVDRIEHGGAVLVVPGMVTLQRELQALNQPCLVELLVPTKLSVNGRVLPNPVASRIQNPEGSRGLSSAAGVSISTSWGNPLPISRAFLPRSFHPFDENTGPHFGWKEKLEKSFRMVNHYP